MALDLTRLKIMLVEDDQTMRALVKQILHAFEISSILEFSDATEALRELNALRPDIVISDWMMEPMDGLTFSRKIRTTRDAVMRTVPIIMLTGHTERKRVEKARDSGITEFLAKPISANGMYLRLQTVIERPRKFVDTKTYHGPDRRRRTLPLPTGETDRRGAGKASKPPNDHTIFELSGDDD